MSAISNPCCRSRSWYQFNDDVVTKIEKLGKTPSGKKIIDLESDSEVK